LALCSFTRLLYEVRAKLRSQILWGPDDNTMTTL
jgi:hypothetical protein